LLRVGGVVAFNGVLDDDVPGNGVLGSARERGLDDGFGTGADGELRDEVDGGSGSLTSMVREDERLVPMLLPLGGGLLAAVLRPA
jgi:hypothetical protein